MTPFEEFVNTFKNKKILVLGLGIQGRTVNDSKLLAEIGAQITVSDIKSREFLAPSIEKLNQFPITYHLGEHSLEDIRTTEVVLRNPSVSWEHPALKAARELRKEIITSESVFFKFAKPKNSIGVTGTRGKSTTTALIDYVLTSNNIPHILAGNLVPTSSMELLKTYDPELWYLFELSSWQLQALDYVKISPHISVITNIYPDHLLDRTFEEYANDKAAITRHQTSTDYVVLNKNSPHTQAIGKTTNAHITWFSAEEFPKEMRNLLPGMHNRENFAAALNVARILDLEVTVEKMAKFQTLPYRQEPIGSINGAIVINDTTSTTPVALVTALQTYPNAIVICGGTTKKLPHGDLIETLNKMAKYIILLEGTGSDEIKDQLDSDKLVGIYQSLETAITAGVKKVKNADDILLFSPGFTSFGMFKNEFDRGEQFNLIIKGYGEFKNKASH